MLNTTSHPLFWRISTAKYTISPSYTDMKMTDGNIKKIKGMMILYEVRDSMPKLDYDMRESFQEASTWRYPQYFPVLVVNCRM